MKNFVPLSENLKFIDYQNAQIILVGTREGRDVIKNEVGIKIKEEENESQQQQQTSDIFTRRTGTKK